MPEMLANEGQRRVAIENILPSVDGGRFAIKRTIGQTIEVTADIFADGHDIVCATLMTRPEGRHILARMAAGRIGQ